MPDEVASLKKSLRIYRGLVEVGGLINSITDYSELLRAVLDVARRVMHAEAASLFLKCEEEGSLKLSIATALEGGYVEPDISIPRGKGIAGWVFDAGQPLLIPDAYKDERFYKEADRQTGFVTRSILCAPLRFDGEVTGVIEVLNPTDKHSFESEDLEGFCAYADLTATAMEKVRALEREREQERVNRDISIASEIQRELLSHAIPRVLPAVEFAAHNVPAANVGGDFYSVFTNAAGDVYFSIGDVSGKGISASLLMAQTLSVMEFVFASAAGPADALFRLNETLAARNIRGMFVTTLVGVFRPSKGQVELSSAGHCQPILVSSDGGAARLDVPSSLPLGVLRGTTYRQSEYSLVPGDHLVMFTDGLTESRGAGDGLMFEEGMLDVLSGANGEAERIVKLLADAESRHRGAGPQLDDLTILVGGPR